MLLSRNLPEKKRPMAEKPFWYFLSLTLLALPGIAGAVHFSDREIKTIQSLSITRIHRQPDITNAVSGNPTAIDLGEALFFDKRLSTDHKFSCASCHQPEQSWTDGKKLQQLRAQPLIFHTPSLLNIDQARWYFWNGHADTLWMQALMPIEAENELNSSRTEIVRLIINDPDYRQGYEQLFGPLPQKLILGHFPERAKPLPLNPTNIAHKHWQTIPKTDQIAINRVFANTGKLIAAFEETLHSQPTLFDDFAERLGKANQPTTNEVISNSAQRGLKLFIGKANCVLCHSGPTFSDSEFHDVFLPDTKKQTDRYAAIPLLRSSEFNANSIYSDAPNGKLRYLRRSIENKHAFKTPTLRNIAQTAPYMHSGKLNTLEDVIGYYSDIKHNKRKSGHKEFVLNLINIHSEQDKKDLVAFLKTLSEKNTHPHYWETSHE